MFDVPNRGDDEIGCTVSSGEVLAQPVGRERFDGFPSAQDGPPQWVIGPEALCEQLVDEVVRRILDHLDLFDHHLLLALDIIRTQRRSHHDIGQHINGQRKMLVKHLQVVTRVFLGGKRVHLPTDRVDRLGNVLGASSGSALEEHVLDEMRDPALLDRLVARTAGEPDTDAYGSHVRHPLGEETKAVGKHVAGNRRWGHRCYRDIGSPGRVRSRMPNVERSLQLVDRQGIRRTPLSYHGRRKQQMRNPVPQRRPARIGTPGRTPSTHT